MVADANVINEYYDMLRDVVSPGDADFFSVLQLQPFSSGIYLRGMLVSGFSNLFFNSYSLVFMSNSGIR